MEEEVAQSNVALTVTCTFLPEQSAPGDHVLNNLYVSTVVLECIRLKYGVHLSQAKEQYLYLDERSGTYMFS